jgi:hypothetical protein
MDQVLEFLVHRSAYQLKEADPHSWAIPRLAGAPKAALVEIQADEYGGGRPERVHARLFADAMDALGLDSTYGAYLDHIPGVTLATVNLMSLCGLHRRLRGAITGHLALFEMTSSIPNRRYAAGLRRLGVEDPRALAFFDEHVEADAVHEQIAAVDLAGGLARMEPRAGRGHRVGCAGARRGRGALGTSPAGRLGREVFVAAAPARGARGRLSDVPLGRLAAELGAARRPEAHELVRAVAERPKPRFAAAAQRDRLAPRVDRVAVLVEQAERPADEQRPVAVGSDGDLVAGRRALVGAGGHARDRTRRRAAPSGGTP